MAFTETEIKKLTDLSNEMKALIKDAENTSNEASVIWGQAGNLFTRALARHAASEAKKNLRATASSEFKAAREARMQSKTKKGGTASTTSQAGTPGTGRSQRSS